VAGSGIPEVEPDPDEILLKMLGERVSTPDNYKAITESKKRKALTPGGKNGEQ
jgi:hypothetical protein